MGPRRYLAGLDRDPRLPLSPSPSPNLACGVGCPQAAGSPGRGRYMAGEKAQGSLITAKDLIWGHSGYMAPLLLSAAQKLQLISAAGRKTPFKVRL